MMRIGVLAVLAATALGLGGCETTRRFMNRSELVAAPAPCGPQRFDVYFDEGQARLTEPARQAIGMTAARLQTCAIRSVQVIGLASATGGSAANMSLSERRAAAVAEALAAAGWPAPVFSLQAAGDQGAVTPTGASEPLRRRTEVVVDAAPH